MSNLPDLPTTNWDSQLALFWHYVRWFMKTNQMWIMLLVGTILAMWLIVIIVDMFKQNKEDDDEYDYEEI